MDKHHAEETRRVAHDKAAFLYMSALERGDFDVITTILAQAETDAELDTILQEVNAALYAETKAAEIEADGQKVRQLLHRHLPEALEADSRTQPPPPLTVGDIVAGLQADAATRRQMTTDDKQTMLRLRQDTTALPDPLSMPNIKRLFATYDFAVSARFMEMFRTKAINMGLGRAQGIGLAARRQPPQHEAEHED